MIQSMSRIGHCIDNNPTEGFWGIIKSEMYQTYKITDEMSASPSQFYREETPQSRYNCKTPAEVKSESLSSAVP